IGAVVNPSVAIIDAPVSAPANQFLTLHSRVTEPTVPGSVTFTYVWSVLDDGLPFALPAGTITNAASFTFAPTPGSNYQVNLQVNDGIGGIGTASALILVADSSPSAQIFVAPGLTAPEGTPITLSNAVTDAALRGPLSYSWTITRNGNPYATETDTIGTFTFAPKEEGTYGVSLTVTDTLN